MSSAIEAVVDFEQRAVIDGDAFEPIHRRYKQIAGVQWLAAVVHLTVILTASRSDPRPNGSAQC